MNQQEANEQFQLADSHFRQGEFEQSLAILDELERYYPENHRVLNAKARTLEQMGRHEEALQACDRLLEVFGYEKIRLFRDKVANKLSQHEWMDEAVVEHSDTPPLFVDTPFQAPTDPEHPAEKPRRFRIKPIPLILLALICGAMYQQWLPYWLGGGLIVAYFLIRLLIGRLIISLFSMPFKMKGKALSGATAQVHAVLPGAAPATEEAEEDDGAPKKAPLRYVWIDLTITPQPRTKGFTHWEPGELALAPASRKIKSLDDHDHCFQVSEVKVFEDDKEVDDDGYKLQGTRRIKLLVGLPKHESQFQFVYYTEAFGKVTIE